jgi:hypothetical protein
VTDFVNLKIKLVQSFRCVHIDRVCAYIIIGVSAHTYMSICVYTVFLKKTRWKSGTASRLLLFGGILL